MDYLNLQQIAVLLVGNRELSRYPSVLVVRNNQEFLPTLQLRISSQQSGNRTEMAKDSLTVLELRPSNVNMDGNLPT